LIPPEFFQRLKDIVPAQDLDEVIRTFSSPRPLVIRINPLKGDIGEVVSRLASEGVVLTPIEPLVNAYLVSGLSSEMLARHPLVDAGRIYQQDPSSMVPAHILGPRPGERVLDACAAPGSKTTQMAAMMRGEGQIVAVEAVKNRFFRLKAVCDLLGAGCVSLKLCDVRRFKPSDGRLFDRVLVDAPCSSEGRFREDVPKSTVYWSPRKIKEMSFKQKGILKSAARLLRPGGVLVYSTCAFAPEENEEVVDWFLHKSDDPFFLEDAGSRGVPRLPCLGSWGKSSYDADMTRCLRIRPDNVFSGFFAAKFRKAEEV
jgi:16S rRNA (cytosine1407-C5)-methyltransferase